MPRASRLRQVAATAAGLILAGAAVTPGGAAAGAATRGAETAATGSLTVRVEDDGGAGIAGAVVTLGPVAGGEIALSGTTDESGAFTFGDVAPGRYRLAVEAEGMAGKVVSPVLLAPGGKDRIVVGLRDASTLAGRVEDAAGQGIPGSEVCLEMSRSAAATAPGERWAALQDGRACRETDGEGRLTFDALPRGAYRVRVRAKDLAPFDGDLDLRGSRESRAWKLRPGGAVRGQVVDAEEKPLPGAVVRLVDRLRVASERDGAPEAETDEKGSFRLFGLPAGSFRLEVEAPNAMPLVRDGIEIEEGRTVSLGVLLVDPGLALSGRVVSGEDEPVAGAEVRVHEHAQHRRRLRTVETDEDGRFLVAGLADEAVDLLVSPPAGFVAALREDVAPPAKDIAIALERTGTVTGTVAVRRGALPARVRVAARGGDAGLRGYPYPSERRPETDEIDPETGRFRLEGVPPGDDATVTASAPGYWSEPVPVSVESGEEAGPVRLLLERGHACEGQVRDRAGSPVAGARVVARSGTSGDVMARGASGADGSFLLEGIHPGTHDVAAEHADFASAERPVSFPMTEGEVVALELGRGGTIEGSVRTEDGDPVEGVAISLADPPRSVRTDASGRYRIERVPEGKRRIFRAGARGYEDYEQRDVDLAEGQIVTVDFRLGRVLEGRVSRGGLPVAGAALTLATPPEWNPDGVGFELAAQSTFTALDGRYRLGGAHAGRGTLTVIDGDQMIQRVLEVPSGTSPRLDLDLPARLVEGRVLAARDDGPLPGAGVRAQLPSPSGRAETGSWSGAMSTSGPDGQIHRVWMTSEDNAETRADASGRFALFVETTTTEVSAYSSGHQWTTQPVGAAGEPLVFRLARTAARRVRLWDGAGRAVPDGWACYVQEGSSSCSHFGAGEGGFQLAEGTYTLVAGGAGHAIQLHEGLELRAGAPPEEENVVLTLAPGTPVRVRWVAPGAAEPKIVSLVDPRGRSMIQYLDTTVKNPDTGEIVWTIRPLEYGVWALSVDPGDGEVVTRSVEIGPGPEVELVLP